ncbi:zeaxanthin epoxidase, chloroplastic [Andrographis paniculata]|uniref:zeaxanthin epoxidase, chloroplastic n=1 Tax=Andrographis paniculata TaxID=175694 RepID=UPI0021E726F8|nr:zeaxanthin epoxidase, chloroplastic [Andrographis paniculata]
MEMTTPHSISIPISIPYSKSRSTLHSSVNFLGYNCLPRNLKFSGRSFAAITAEASVRWLLQPIGDGDSRHIGYKITLPGAFEVASNVVTVGRALEKADVVLPVPTVSALHARIEKTDENLLITDLDSTNGTFINDKRLKPGVVSPAVPGNRITFGDTNLAIFRVYKFEEDSGDGDGDGDEGAEDEAEAAAA